MLSGGSPKFRGKCEQSGGGCRENRPCSPGQTKRLREEGLTGEELVEHRKYRMNRMNEVTGLLTYEILLAQLNLARPHL